MAELFSYGVDHWTLFKVDDGYLCLCVYLFVCVQLGSTGQEHLQENKFSLRIKWFLRATAVAIVPVTAYFPTVGQPHLKSL